MYAHADIFVATVFLQYSRTWEAEREGKAVQEWLRVAMERHPTRDKGFLKKRLKEVYVMALCSVDVFCRFKAERKRATKTAAELRAIADRSTAVTRAKTSCKRLLKVLDQFSYTEDLPGAASEVGARA